jgi:hypothetical protein
LDVWREDIAVDELLEAVATSVQGP